jgi:hypothetical protein
MIQIARIYEPAQKSHGWRVAVDRLWLRGIKKENAHVDLWMKAKRGAARVVWTQTGTMDGVSTAIRGRVIEEERTGCRIETSSENARQAHTTVWSERQGT